MAEKKDFFKWEKKDKSPKPKFQKIEAGTFKEKEKKELENQIINSLKKLNSNLTKREILALMNSVEVWKGLDWLRKILEKDKKLWDKEISDDALRAILDLIKEVKEITLHWIEELKLELTYLNESKEYTIDKKVYLSSKFSWIKKIEESPLWKNIIIDIAWITIWTVDSATAIFKILLWFIKDLFLIPRDIVKKLKIKN